jgi:hypothetical protein
LEYQTWKSIWKRNMGGVHCSPLRSRIDLTTKRTPSSTQLTKQRLLTPLFVQTKTPDTFVCFQILHRSIPVYNIEVHGGHVYQVGELGLLVHNACTTHMHHSIPRAIQRRLAEAGSAAASSANVIGRAGLPNRISVEAGLHRLIHSGKGYIQLGGIGGGHYNNAFHNLILKNGGYKNISADDVVHIRNILVNWFKL